MSYWKSDAAATRCEGCCKLFTTFWTRRHHCRDCGGIFCADCSSISLRMPHRGIPKNTRCCKYCRKFIDGKISSKQPMNNNNNPTNLNSAANDEYLKFGSMRMKMEPEEEVLDGSRLNRTLRKYEKMFLCGPATSQEGGLSLKRGGSTLDPPPSATAMSGSFSVNALQPVGKVHKSLLAISLPLIQGMVNRELAFPAAGATPADLSSFLASSAQVAVLTNSSVTSYPQAANSFVRVRDGITAAHKLAQGTETHPVSVLQNVSYY